MRIGLVLGFAIGAAACGKEDASNTPSGSGPGSGSGDGGAAEQQPGDVPVATNPLAGTVGGNPFGAKVALANYQAKSGTANVFIFDTDRTCADYQESREGWAVIVAGKWYQRVVPDIMHADDLPAVIFQQTQKESTSFRHSSFYARSGRLEILEAPTEKGAKGHLRVRGDAPEGHHVDGDVRLEICAVYPDR